MQQLLKAQGCKTVEKNGESKTVKVRFAKASGKEL